MRLWPKSLFGQIMLTMLFGLFTTHLIGIGLIWNDRSDLAAKITGYHAAERIAGIIELLDEDHPTSRALLIKSLSVPPLSISLDQPWKSMPDQNPAETDFFLRQLDRALGAPYKIQATTISQEPPWRKRPDTDSMAWRGFGAAMGHRHNRMIGRAVGPVDDSPYSPPKRRLILMARVQAQLSDGQVITFLHYLKRDPIDWPSQIFGLFLLLGAAVALLTLWVVSFLTKPLRILSNAAIGLSKDLDQAPLPETGSTEVAAAAHAFNTMQIEIKRYLDTRSQTLAALSHDLRLPITRIRLRIESLLDSHLKGKLEDDLADIDTMIDNTLAFLRAGKSNEENMPIDMNALIDSVVGDTEALGATVSVNGKAERPITGQPQALRRCLANLMDNARRYGGGQIDLEVIDRDKEIEIMISDRGPGIPDDDKEKVFEPYIRLETSRAKHTGGSGLGMATARVTARRHGGDIRLRDRDGGGLTTTIVLPRSG